MYVNQLHMYIVYLSAYFLNVPHVLVQLSQNGLQYEIFPTFDYVHL